MIEKPAPHRIRMNLLQALSLAALALGLAAVAAPVKMKVTYPPGAPVYKEPRLAQESLAKLPLDTIVDAEEKKGKFWKVTILVNGVQTTGYVREEMVMEISPSEAAGASAAGLVKSQAEIVAGINFEYDQARELVRQHKDLPQAVEKLRAVIAKAFSIEEHSRRKEVACNLYLWLGHAFYRSGDTESAIREYQNVFDADPVTAQKAVENVPDPDMYQLIAIAEKKHRGEFEGYSVRVETEPKDALIRVDGKEVGRSPHIFTVFNPKITLDIEKDGYDPIQTAVTLREITTSTMLHYELKRSGRALELNSKPPGANVFLDGQDTGHITNCVLPVVSFGMRALALRKMHYADWEENIEVGHADGPLTRSVILTVSDYVPLRSWGGPDRKLFNSPQTMALDKSGNMYVIDAGREKLRKFNAEGVFQKTWGSVGQHFKKLKRPAGVAVDGQGNIYVTDAGTHSVSKFDKNGQPVRSWGKFGIKEGELNLPHGIAVDRYNDILVVDQGNARIVRYSADGAFKKMWGRQGADKGQLVRPTGIAVSPNGEILVVDQARVLRFTEDGAFIDSFGKEGTAAGEFRVPLGIAIDSDGIIYVADAVNNCVMKFDSVGRFICQWGTVGSDTGQMRTPCAVVIDAKGSVYVLERGNHRLQVFSIGIAETSN